MADDPKKKGLGTFGQAALGSLAGKAGDLVTGLAGGIFGGLFGGGGGPEPSTAVQQWKYAEPTQDLDMGRRLLVMGRWHPQLAGMFLHNQGANSPAAKLAQAFGMGGTGDLKNALFGGGTPRQAQPIDGGMHPGYQPMGNTAGGGFGLGGGRFGQNPGGQGMYDMDTINSLAQDSAVDLPPTQMDQLRQLLGNIPGMASGGDSGPGRPGAAGAIRDFQRQYGQMFGGG